MKKGMIIAAVALIASGAIGGKIYAGKVADEELHKAVVDASATGVVKYESVSVGWLGGITLHSVAFGPREELRIDSLEIASLDRDALDNKQFPSYGDIRIKGFELAISEKEMKNFFPALYELGYRNVRGDLNLEYTYSTEDKQMVVDEASLTLDEAGTLELALQVEVPFSSISNPLAILAALDQGKISSGSMIFENDGFVDHLLTLAKYKRNQSKEEFLKEIEQQASGSSSAVEKEVLIAMHDFLEGGDKLKASIDPSSPVSINRVVTAIRRGDFSTLNISITGS